MQDVSGQAVLADFGNAVKLNQPTIVKRLRPFGAPALLEDLASGRPHSFTVGDDLMSLAFSVIHFAFGYIPTPTGLTVQQQARSVQEDWLAQPWLSDRIGHAALRGDYDEFIKVMSPYCYVSRPTTDAWSEVFSQEQLEMFSEIDFT